MVAYKGMFSTIESVSGLESALFGMRNPMNSWNLSDSTWDNEYDCLCVGEKDMGLCERLIKAGHEHRKFLRMIHVQLDVNMPRYWWSEADTYHFGTKNSCSTMHKLLNSKKGIEMSDFYVEYEDLELILKGTIDQLNHMRDVYLDTKDINILRRAKSILPECFLQRRMWDTNYEELRNIYKQRKNHRLDKEWGLFLKELESLPYFEEFIKN